TIFERSPVTRITFDRKIADVFTSAGSIRTSRVVVTTGTPTRLYKALRRHFWFRTAFLALTAPVPSQIRHQLGQREAVVRDSADPAHIFRWVDDRLLVTGADAPTAPVQQRD